MTSYQGYHQYDLSSLTLILMTWMRGYLSCFSSVKLFPLPCLSILYSLAESHYMQLTLGSLTSLKAESLYKLFVILHSRHVSFPFVCHISVTHEYLFYMLSYHFFLLYFVGQIVPTLVTEQSLSWLLCTYDILLSMWMHLFIYLFIHLLLPYFLAL